MSMVMTLPVSSWLTIEKDTSHVLYEKVAAINAGWPSTNEKGWVESNGQLAANLKINYAYWRKSVVIDVMAAGGDMSNMPIWIIVPAANYNDDVPDYVPNYQYQVDDSGTMATHSWSTWLNGGGEPHRLDTGANEYWIPSNANTTDNVWMLASELNTLFDSGYSLKDTMDVYATF